MTEKDILRIIQEDNWMMQILKIAKELNLPDWMIGAGFVRSKVWDYLHNYKTRTPLGDIDLIYYDPKDLNEATEKEYEKILKTKLNEVWSVKNQVRMHSVNGDPEYTSSEDALRYWPETATAVAVKIGENNQLKLIAPYGLNDLIEIIARPCPLFRRKMDVFRHRYSSKRWKDKWPKLAITEDLS